MKNLKIRFIQINHQANPPQISPSLSPSLVIYGIAVFLNELTNITCIISIDFTNCGHMIKKWFFLPFFSF